jgi:hypothetical protein
VADAEDKFSRNSHMTVRCPFIQNTCPELHFLASSDGDCTKNYPISEKYRDVFNSIASHWRVAPFPAFDTEGNLMAIPMLEDALSESLVLVCFELKHSVINDDTSRSNKDSFIATATHVKVLAYDAEHHPPL